MSKKIDPSPTSESIDYEPIAEWKRKFDERQREIERLQAEKIALLKQLGLLR